jgi:hypothetical protein
VGVRLHHAGHHKTAPAINHLGVVPNYRTLFCRAGIDDFIAVKDDGRILTELVSVPIEQTNIV